MVSPKTRYLVFFQYFGKGSTKPKIRHSHQVPHLEPNGRWCPRALQLCPLGRPEGTREAARVGARLQSQPPPEAGAHPLWEHVIKAVWVTGRQSWGSSRLSNFSTFCSLNSETPLRSPVRTILQADIHPSASLLSHHYEYRGLEFWELQFRSRSFLYRQVRRMAGALVAVGQGKLSPHHVKELLEKKNSRAFPPYAVAPPSGLFLKSVAYNEADLETRTMAE